MAPRAKTNAKPTQRRPYAIWKVDDTEYKLILKTAGVCDAEAKLKGQNLINFIGSENGLPTLNSMIIIVHCAMLFFQHSVKLEEVYDLYDKYIDEGGSMMNFYTEVFMEVYQVSGFLSGALGESLGKLVKEL